MQSPWRYMSAADHTPLDLKTRVFLFHGLVQMPLHFATTQRCVGMACSMSCTPLASPMYRCKQNVVVSKAALMVDSSCPTLAVLELT